MLVLFTCRQQQQQWSNFWSLLLNNKSAILNDMKVMSNSWLMRPFFASVRNDCLHSPSAQQLSGLLPEIKWLLWCEDSGGPRPLSCCSSVAVGLCPLNVILILMKFKKDLDQVQVANFLEIMNFHIKVWFKAQLRPAPCVESQLSRAVVGAWCIVLPVH